MSRRADFFEESTPSDLSDFQPGAARDPVDPAAMRRIAAERGFTDRGEGAAVQASLPVGIGEGAAGPVRRRRVVRAPRSVQLNVRITAAHQARFIACLDRLGESVSQADGIELAIEKLEASLDVGRDERP